MSAQDRLHMVFFLFYGSDNYYHFQQFKFSPIFFFSFTGKSYVKTLHCDFQNMCLFCKRRYVLGFYKKKKACNIKLFEKKYCLHYFNRIYYGRLYHKIFLRTENTWPSLNPGLLTKFS